jgi:hypothetical protein
MIELINNDDNEFENVAVFGNFWRLFLHASEIYSVGMTNRLYNWTYRDVTNFIKQHGFCYDGPLKGSHEAWVKLGENGEPDRIVEINYSHTSYPPKTLKTMIHQSGIHRDVWIKWAEGKR